MADFYRSEGLRAPKAQHADDAIDPDPTYKERAARYVDLGLVPTERIENVRSLSPDPAAG